MANYNETTAPGSSWTRYHNAYVMNEYSGTSAIIFGEQKAVVVDQTVTTLPLNTEVRVQFDANKTFDLLDPTTGQPTGTTYTQKQLYEILNSLYIASAKQRDIDAAERMALLNQQGVV